MNDNIARSLTFLIEVGEFTYNSMFEGSWN